MRPNPKFTRALQYTTLTLGLLTAAVAVSTVRHSESLPARLLPVEQRRVNNEIATMHFNSARSAEGFTAPKDTHVLFTVPQGTRIARNVFLGPDHDKHPYWGYCFTKDRTEARRKADGVRGMALYDKERFFYSKGELGSRKKRNTVIPEDLVDVAGTLHGAASKETKSFYEVFESGDLCYLMTSVDLPAGIDTDFDLVNNALERMHNTNPQNQDSDRDGAPDGAELFVMRTNPLLWDSDLDGLPDSCEDSDYDGIDYGETNPNNPDSDKDGLCDGAGAWGAFGSGCPEDREVMCTRNASTGERTCDTRPSEPAFGEDMNLNCAVDEGETDPTNPTTFGEWRDRDWKLKNADWSVGVAKPELPIPDLPGYDLEDDPES